MNISSIKSSGIKSTNVISDLVVAGLPLTSSYPYALPFENNSDNIGVSTGSISLVNTTFNSNIKKFGSYALDLNGTNAYMGVDTNLDQNVHTTAMWIYPRSHNPSGRSYIVDYRDDPHYNASYGYWLFDSNNTATFGGSSEYIFSFTPTFNTWQHWALVCDGTNMTWYVDGSQVATAARVCTTSNSLTNGCYFARNTGTANYWMNAVVDNFVFTYEALSQTQIQDLYQSGTGF